jgi:hypothetical protein
MAAILIVTDIFLSEILIVATCLFFHIRVLLDSKY